MTAGSKSPKDVNHVQGWFRSMAIMVITSVLWLSIGYAIGAMVPGIECRTETGKGGDAVDDAAQAQVDNRDVREVSPSNVTTPRPEANAPRRGYTPEQALALHEACVHLVERLDGTHEHGDGVCAIWIAQWRWEFAWEPWAVTLEARED